MTSKSFKSGHQGYWRPDPIFLTSPLFWWASDRGSACKRVWVPHMSRGTRLRMPSADFFNLYYFTVRIWRCLFVINHSFLIILGALEEEMLSFHQDPTKSKNSDLCWRKLILKFGLGYFRSKKFENRNFEKQGFQLKFFKIFQNFSIGILVFLFFDFSEITTEKNLEQNFKKKSSPT